MINGKKIQGSVQGSKKPSEFFSVVAFTIDLPILQILPLQLESAAGDAGGSNKMYLIPETDIADSDPAAIGCKYGIFSHIYELKHVSTIKFQLTINYQALRGCLYSI